MDTVIYARYSSSAQTEQSIEGQLKECYAYAERNGYAVIGEYIDRAISGGAAENRPEFMRMIEDSATQRFQAILVYQLDRFARSRYDSAMYKSRLKKNGVRVISARESISEDASGVLTEAILEGMAEYFSRELSQKIRRGLEISANKCLYTGNGAALGYKITDRKFAIDEDTAPIVRQIFAMFLAGNRMADIMHSLNARGIKTSKGNPYNKNSIKRILTNRRYLGYYIHGEVEIPGGVPRIIDDDTFEKAQVLLSKLHKKDAEQLYDNIEK